MHAPARSLIETRSHQMFPTLAPEEIERLRRFGEPHACRAGERLVEAGELSPGLFVPHDQVHAQGLRRVVAMTEREKYAEIFGQPGRITAEDRAAFRRIWHKVWGDELAYELAPTNFITWHELHRVAAELRVRAGSHFVDLGCGAGGPGLWIAGKTGASVVGIDFSPEACSAARRQAAKFEDVTAEYRIADMTSTGLPDASADAAMSIDAMQIVPSRISAFREAARLLRPSARFVLTTWDHPGVMPQGALLPGREIVPDGHANRSAHVFVVCEIPA